MSGQQMWHLPISLPELQVARQQAKTRPFGKHRLDVARRLNAMTAHLPARPQGSECVPYGVERFGSVAPAQGSVDKLQITRQIHHPGAGPSRAK
jgi:hypothetical protein